MRILFLTLSIIAAVTGASFPVSVEKDECILTYSVCDSLIPETIIPEDTITEETIPEETSSVTPVPEETEQNGPEFETQVPAVTQPSQSETQAPSSTQPSQSEAAGENVTEPVQTIHPYILRVVELVNEERAKAGLNPVTIDLSANNAAMVRAKEIVRNFSHTRPDGSSFATAMKEQGINYRLAGENIAWGQRSPEQVMEAWMNSPGHRANILNESYTNIGVGYYQESGVNYWTQLFFK